MRTVTYKSVLDGVLKRRGIAPAAAQKEQVEQLNEFIADRLLTAWEYYRWPEVVVLEKRFFRAEWKRAIYPVGAEVYHAGRNWRAKDGAGPGDEPGVPSGPGFLLLAPGTYLRVNAAGDCLQVYGDNYSPWEELSWLRRDVNYEQPGFTPIEAVLGAWDKDPLADISALRIPYTLGPDGVIFPPDYKSTSIWIEYRRRAPDFAWSEPWQTQAYAANQVVYKAPEVYRSAGAVAEDVPGVSRKWIKQDFPYILARAVKEGAACDAQGAAGQEDKELVEEGKFTELLEEQVWQLTKLQGQTGRPTVIPPQY